MVLMAIVAIGFMQGYRINTTPSYPIGIYKLNQSVSELRVGDLVAFCPRKEGVFKFSSERGYLERGICESGLEHSFDSRYFGPIPSDWIYARAEPVWVASR